MEKKICPFGPFFRQERKAKNISQWHIVHKMSTYLANIQRIEAGIQQPGVHLALRLINVIGVKPGDFMQKFARECLPYLPQSISPIDHVSILYEIPLLKEGQKSLFGLFLVQARLAGTVSQTAMAKAAKYSLRNINTVESGRQEPGIMTALALVMTTGVDVREFFNTLYACWREQQASVQSTSDSHGTGYPPSPCLPAQRVFSSGFPASGNTR